MEHKKSEEPALSLRRVESEVIDVGLPLDAGEYDEEESLLPKVRGFKEHDDNLLAVVISHSHQDHYGLAKYLRSDLPVVIDKGIKSLLDCNQVFGKY